VDPFRTTLVLGQQKKFYAVVYLPDGQRNGNVRWSSSDDRIAVVNPDTGTVTDVEEDQRP
jgi:uncharacterized protein YjdB